MNKLILCLCTLLLLVSCNAKDSKHTDTVLFVDLMSVDNLADFKLSNFGDSVRYVPLETTDSCLIGNDPQIKLLEDKIMVVTSKQCLLFNKQTGKYVCSVGHIGDDPEGYSSTDCSVDDAGFIYFVRLPGQLIKYDQAGQMVGVIEVPHDPIAPNYFVCSDSIIIGHYSGYMGISTRALVFFDTAGGVKDTIPSLIPPTSLFHNEDIVAFSILRNMDQLGLLAVKGIIIIRYKDQSQLMMAPNDPVLWKCKDEVRFRESFMDTIYTIRENRLEPYMIFGTRGERLSASNILSGDPKAMGVSYVNENERLVFFQFIQGKQVYSGIYDKLKNDTEYAKAQKFIPDDFNRNFKIEMSTLCSYKDQYGFLVQTGAALNWLDEHPDEVNGELSFLNQLDEEANPIVVIVN